MRALPRRKGAEADLANGTMAGEILALRKK
jgi:hypothetical protein